MEIDGRESAKCQKSKLGDIDDIIEFVLNDNKTKLCIVSSSSNLKRGEKREERGRTYRGREFLILEREREASL